MNNFTKDELKEIVYCVAHYQSCKWSNRTLLHIESKLKSMIENYCEHEYHAVGTGQFMFAQCCKCGDKADVARK